VTKIFNAIPSAEIAADNFIKKGLFPDNPDKGKLNLDQTSGDMPA